MERPIHTEFDFNSCFLTVNDTTKNDRHRSTCSGPTHISQIGKLGYSAHGTSDSHRI